MLFCDSDGSCQPGRWRFVLRSADGSKQLSAEDVEPGVHGERLDLLALVRGLEALDQPSRVTLVTPSRYLRRGLRSGLPEWRRTGWQWEYFGQMVPVKHRDLWRRVERALRYHRLACRTLRFDSPHAPFPLASARKMRPAAERQPAPRAEEAIRTSPRRVTSLNDPLAGGPRSSPPGHVDRSNPLRSWHFGLGLGKLFGLVKLFAGNRPGSLAPAVVCREV